MPEAESLMSKDDLPLDASSRIASGLGPLEVLREYSTHHFARPTVPRGVDLAESDVDAVGLADLSGAGVMPRIGVRVE
ncbi:MAG: hypothetical protein ACXVGB_11180 [Mycobacteriaceae bacterium]